MSVLMLAHVSDTRRGCRAHTSLVRGEVDARQFLGALRQHAYAGPGPDLVTLKSWGCTA